MATIKVFSTQGAKELHCFDTLDEVAYETASDDGLADFLGINLEDEQIE